MFQFHAPSGRGELTIQGCLRSSAADGRVSWLSSNVFWRKFSASEEISAGMVGFELMPIWLRIQVSRLLGGDTVFFLTLKMACICDNCGYGCSPVSISTTRQPTLQMSAFCVYAVCFTTSGAIQNTEPWSDGRCARFPSFIKSKYKSH